MKFIICSLDEGGSFEIACDEAFDSFSDAAQVLDGLDMTQCTIVALPRDHWMFSELE